MSSVFLSTGFDTTVLEDGSLTIFGASLGAANLTPTFPVKVDNDQNLISENLEIADVNGLQAALNGFIANPFNGTLQVQDLQTAYNTTPVNLNSFIATTLTDISTLQSNTQYITASLGQTNISSNILTNDIEATRYKSQDGSVFIDMTTPGDISVNSTTFDFNADPVVVSTSGSSTNNNVAVFDLTTGHKIKDSGILSTNLVTNTAGSTGSNVAVFLGSSGKVIQDTGLLSSNIVSNTAGSTGSNVCIFSGISGKVIQDTGISASSISGGPFLPLAGGTMSGNVQMGTNVLTINNMSTTGLTGQVWGLSSSGSTAGSIVIGDASTGVGDVCILGRNTFNTSTSGKSTLVGINNTAAAGATQGICLGFDNVCENNGGQICIGSLNTTQGLNSVCIGSGLVNVTPNSILIGATGQNLVNIRPQSNATCDLGATASNYFNNAYLSGNLAGNTFSRAVDNIVSNNGGSTGSNIAVYSGTSGKIIQDTGILSTNLVSNTNGSTGSNVAFFSGTSGKLLTDLGVPFSSISGGPFLKLAGGTMSGSIDMGGQTLSNMNSIITTDGNVRIGNIASATSTNGVAIGPGANANGLSSTAIGDTTTANASRSVAIGAFSAAGTFANGIGSGANASGQNSSAVGTDSSASGTDSLALGNSANAANDSSIALGSNASNAIANTCVIGDSSFLNFRPGSTACDLGATGSKFQDLYISRNITGCTFTGRVDMGTNVLTVNQMSDNGVTGIRWGKGATCGGTGTIVIGDNSTMANIQDGSLIGRDSRVSDTQCSVFGVRNTINAGATLSTLVGWNNVSSSQGGVCIGFSSNSAAQNAFCLGHGLTNVTANSLLIGSTEALQNLINIRPQTNSTCDLGTSGQNFNNLFITGAISNIAYGAWYCTTTYNPSFTANVNRLTPPTVASSGSLSLFTQSFGVLTYIGTRTRIFKIDYIISYLSGPSTANMTFFNSKNASTTLGTTQTRSVIQTTPSNNATVLSCSFSDIISLATNDTVQLAAQCANVTTSAVAFQFVMCNIIGLLN